MGESSSTTTAVMSTNSSPLPAQNPDPPSPPERSPKNPSSLPISGCPTDEPPLPHPPPPPPARRLPAVRISSEYDSESSAFLNKVSCRVFNGLAKIKAQFQSNRNGDINYPQIGFITKYLSVLYDYEDQNAVVTGSFDVGSRLQVKGVHDVKSRQGDIKLVATMPDPSYKVELGSPVPFAGLPRASLRFPHGEILLEEKEVDEVKRALSVSGVLKNNILNGVCTAQFKDEDLNLRYSYKDEQVTFIPSLSLPSNVLSFAFKRRFGPSDKLSYIYNFNSSYWNAVYKHTFGNDFKVKAGYDSEVRLGWASLWVGKEDEGAKGAPMKVKLQLMLQVPQDNIHATALLFRLKKRWDL
ncbi:outer envelope pore protein 37, chloroplastic isoform X3 [Nymphaea colorata]|uniref:outer envelope pore protein 37, chloroplastic isoform X3 n=1 Tax=Nymphaea colorata TaxID=210225 RepID=UPI00129DCE8C|nr:outer envelope pore protein 37, chloroplastic isoform X3 [Nymphaea colorata]